MSEFFDPNFTPNITSLIDENRHEYTIQRLAITPNAVPVVSYREQRVGLWFGQLITRYKEFPVITVAIDNGVRLTPFSGQWFYGTSHQKAILDSPTPFDDMVDSASIPVPNPGRVIQALNYVFPSESFPEAPRQLILPAINRSV